MKQSSKCDKKNLRKNPQLYKQMIWDLAILLHFNNEIKNTKKNKWQKCINKFQHCNPTGL